MRGFHSDNSINAYHVLGPSALPFEIMFGGFHYAIFIMYVPIYVHVSLTPDSPPFTFMIHYYYYHHFRVRVHK
jgi:hypothetical protein